MAVLAAIATGAATDLTAAATWGLVDATSYLNSEAGAAALTTAYSGNRSSAFTPGAITIDGIAVRLNVRTGTTGTMSVDLIKSSDSSQVAGTEVTINCSDLQAATNADVNGGWIFFKFASPVTLAAATAYKLEAKTSSASMISLWRDATASNMSRYLRTTTTQAPVAGDDMIIVGELTGAAAFTAAIVTMNQTATTDYGSATTSLVTAAISVGDKGTLTFGTAASTNYNLKVSGCVVVHAGGTINVGTVAIPVPRTSTVTWLFDSVALVDFGLVIFNLGTFTSQGLSRTSGKNVMSCLLNGDAAVNATTLNVNTDTGWLSGDEIAVASTTRTNTQGENGTLNGNAGASSLTVNGFAGTGGGVLNAHGGTAPVQGEIILLTRNILITGVSTTGTFYGQFRQTSVVDIDWTAFKFMGNTISFKNGLCVVTSAGGSFALSYSCIRDGINNSVNVYLGAGQAIGVAYTNVTVEYCGFWLPNGGIGFQAGTTTQTSWTVNQCVGIAKAGSQIIFLIGDVGGTFTNNTAVGGGGIGIQISEASTTATGTFSGLTAHSNVGSGLLIGNFYFGTFTNLTAWRNAGNAGLELGGNTHGAIFDTVTLFGNAFSNVQLSSCMGVVFKSVVASGDTTFATGTGITAYIDIISDAAFENCTFGVVTGIKTAHTQDMSASFHHFRLTFRNCTLASATQVASQGAMTPGGYVRAQKLGGVSGVNKTWYRYGTITREVTTVHTGGQSAKMTPINASNKLELPVLQKTVASGATIAVGAFVYEDAAYNGARSRLILKKNIALGINADTVLSTATAASDAAWEQLTATTPAASEDGVMEFVVDCDGTAGNLFVDSISAS